MADPFADAGFAPAAQAPTMDPFASAGFAPGVEAPRPPKPSELMSRYVVGNPMTGGFAINLATPEGQKAQEGYTRLMEKAGEGATFGLLPHIIASARSLFGTPYQEGLKSARDYTAQTEKDAPGLSTAMEAAGGILPGIGLFRAAGPAVDAVSTALPRIGPTLANAVLGAGYGAANAAGHDIGSGEGNIGPDAAKGAAIGGLVSGAAPLVGSMAQAVPNMVSGITTGIRNALTTGGQEGIAGQVLREAAGPGPLAFDTSPVPGLNLTTPQATNNPGLAALQRAMASEPGVQSNIPGQFVSSGRTPDQMNALARALVGGGAGTEPTVLANEASARGVQAIQAAREALRGHEQSLWQAPALDAARMDLPTLVGGVGQDVAGMPASFRQAITGGPLAPFMSDLAELPAQASVADVNAVRSRILGQARAAAAHGDSVTSAAGNSLADSVLSRMEGALGNNPDTIAAYQAARDFTRQRAQAFGYPEFDAILRPNVAGNMRANDETAFGRFFDTNTGTGAGLERLQGVSDLLRQPFQGNAPALIRQLMQGSPMLNAANGLDTATRDYLGPAALLRARAGAGLDATGAPVINPQTLASTVNRISPAIAGTPMTASAAPNLEAAGNAAELLNRPAVLRGDMNSTTYEKLKTNDLMNAILGQAGSSALGAAAGGLAGYEYGPEGVPWYLRIPAGAAAGAMAGNKAGPQIGRALGHFPVVGDMMAGPSTVIRQQIWQALNDPAVYQRMAATPVQTGPAIFQEGRTARAVTPLIRALMQPATEPGR